ncbi:major vault protein [Angomonas deanei]|uniref:Major Vault Protein repeat domain/Major Vault Protein Repeat domain/Shoulder domain containing protein, putative n=1 Tax=Angomonas deanei TaxID=59799 RepID=A0A7G2C593_9TRYP|nr:major vault protein [Angomonas deanei]CAD2214314.1 Major Vault Protein repeat domain/Major Vault Protein Repeat domain/Shoulder domain containing protein, putative [Angomonas deanei]|eukprot:EPY27153.1 major vault protein [Angomonas deanei]
MSYSAPQLILRLQPYHYAHVANENNNTTMLVVGPQNYTLSSNETVVTPTKKFVVVPSGYYCKIKNPICTTKDANGSPVPVLDESGQVRCRVGEIEYRYNVQPFPLYPDEELLGINSLDVVSARECLMIRIVKSYGEYKEGDSRIFKGPGTYYPRSEEEIARREPAVVVEKGQGLCAMANYDVLHPTTKVEYYSGELYLLLTPGFYFPNPYETVQSVVTGRDLLNEGLHIEVTRGFVDNRDFAKGIQRKSGDVYMVTGEECPCFILHPYEKILKSVEKVFVAASEYCVVVNSHGDRKVLTNTHFYLQPGETMEAGSPNSVYLLSSEQAVLVRALADHTGKDGTKRRCGDRWLVKGPSQFIPSAYTTVEEDPLTGKDIREKVLLIEGEGIYIRNTISGETRLLSGPTGYLLEAHEEVFEKPVSDTVRHLLENQHRTHVAYVGKTATKKGDDREEQPIVYTDDDDGDSFDGAPSREGTGTVSMCDLPENKKAIVYHIPYRSVTQLYNYKTQKTRVVFGPEQVMLEPDEEFTVVSLSGSPWDAAQPTKCLPKEPHRISALYLFLGPSNMSDVVHVETRDHAQLTLQLCYDWYFDIPYGDGNAAVKCFSVTDFVGDACSFIASNIRAVVASLFFEDFHRNSAKLLKEAVFGIDPATNEARKELRFPANHLVITSVDAQEMEVSDERTKQGLQKSVKMAIELATHAQEVNAQQVASEREQVAHGKLERQKMMDQVANEEQRKKFLEAENMGLEYVHAGKSRALAEAISEATKIEGDATVKANSLRVQKEQLLFDVMSELQERKKVLIGEQESALSAEQRSLEAQLADIKLQVMEQSIAALGAETMGEIAKAGPALQAKLLGSLGLEGYLVTDGKTPINLFRTAEGLSAPSQ